MKIDYVWIGEFRHLESFGISLSSEHEFSFCRETGMLSREQKKPLPKDFFGSEVSQLTGLIGCSGKTTALELVCKVTAESNELTEYLIIYEVDGKLYYHSDMEVTASFDINKGSAIDPDKLDVIFYSPKPEDYDLCFSGVVKDLSLNNIVNTRGYNYLIESQSRYFGSKDCFLPKESAPKFNVLGDTGYWDGLDMEDLMVSGMLASVWGSFEDKAVIGKKPTLICLDNVDSRWHLECQVKFISKLIELLPKQLKNKVQIVVSTNSPLVITDIPSHCIFDMDEESTFSGSSFGGNIYDVFRDAFKIEGRTGLLSARYLDQTVFPLLDKPSDSFTPDDIKELRSASDVVGDELILFHIKQRLKEFS